MQKPIDIHKTISKFRVFTDDATNILSQNSIECKSGKWFIPPENYQEFLELIHKALKANPTRPLHFMERPSKTQNMVKLDFDLRFTATDDEIKNIIELKHRYNDEFLELIANCIKEHIEKIVNIKDSFNIYIQEKKKPRLSDNNVIKNGIHIIIPDLVLNNIALFQLRDLIIKDETLEEALHELGNTSPLEKVVDPTIIETAGWYIYGCGKPDDKGDYYKISKIYKVVKKGSTTTLKKIGLTSKTLLDNIMTFSNFGKEHNIEYLIDLDDTNINSSNYGNNLANSKVFSKQDKNNILRMFALNQSNFRNNSNLTDVEIKTYLNCLKKSRVDDYQDWRKVGLSLYNMSHKNFDIWDQWSSGSAKYKEADCVNVWYNEFPKFSKYNLGLHKLKEMARQDNHEEYNKILINNKMQFFKKWITDHVKESHIKNLSIHTISKYIKEYIKDYANFNIACACPGALTSIWYKFDNHRWTEDKAANKIYMHMTVDLYNELTTFHEELKQKMQQYNNMSNSHDDNVPDDSEQSFMQHIRDNRPRGVNIDEQASKEIENLVNKQMLVKSGALLDFLSAPVNKKKIIEDLSQKCFDEEFYKNLDENRNVMVCNNGVLDLEKCVFRTGEPDDMMTITCKITFPKNIESLEAQDIIHALQDWLDKIFPDDEIQEYVLNILACKLSGKRFGEKFIICKGTGANGKSQLFKQVAKVFGDYYQPFDNTLLNTQKSDPNAPSPSIARLKGTRIAVTTEPKNGQPFESDKVKELVSGDELIGRHLNKDPITFVPQYQMFLQCNDIPRNESTDDGFWRKIFVIPFDAKFVIKEEDMYKLNNPKFPNHFKAQDQEHLYGEWAPYLLHMLFERYKVLMARNFVFPTPEKVMVATKIYQKEASTYTDFFDSKMEAAPGYKIDLATLYAEFQLDVGRDFKANRPTFVKQMERYIKKPKGMKKEYYGFRLKNTTGETIEDE